MKIEANQHLRPFGEDAVTGIVSWLIIIVTVLGTMFVPRLWVYVAGAFLFYFVGRMLFHFVLYLVGDHRNRQWAKRDWTVDEGVAGVGGLAPKDVFHVVLLPNYTEEEAVLLRTLDALAVQHRASERLMVVLGMEEREEGAREKGERLAAEFEGRFAKLLVTVHPKDLPGELKCKSANMRYSALIARGELRRMGVPLENVTITAADADSVLHPKYLAAVSELFARDDKRYKRFWQAPLFYYNNIWEVPGPIRLSAWFIHAGMVAELATPGFDVLPISTYTMSIKLCEECDWWDPAVISEDWHSYLNATVIRNGDVCSTPVFLPTLSDSADGNTWVQAMTNRYVQVLRHSWGAEDAGFLIRSIKTHGAKRATVLRLIQVIHDHCLRVASWVILMSMYIIGRPGGSVFPTLDNGVPTGALWQIIGTLYTIGFVLFALNVLVDLVRFPPPKGRGVVRFVAEMVVLWLTLPLQGAYLGMMPALHAQTKLMLGIPLAWKVTPKKVGAVVARPQATEQRQAA